MTGETLWRRGSRVLFGQMYEDVELELRAFAGCGRVFCIASAGCSAIALSVAHEVTAVDINRDQLVYAQARAAGSAAQRGQAESVMAAGRQLMRMAGWTPRRLEAFIRLTDCGEQLEFWRSQLDGRLFRLLFDTSIATSLFAIGRLTPLKGVLPAHGFGAVMRGRLERSLTRFPNASNPYARANFAGEHIELGPARKRIQFEHADAARYLESCPAGSFDAFSLSNILDGATGDMRAVLRRQSAPLPRPARS